MSVEVIVPAVGESISTGVVSVWHKKSGEKVNAGDPLFTLETDKVSTEINAEKDGVLQTLVAEGAEVKIGDVVATIEDAGAAPEQRPGKSETKAASATEKSDAPKQVSPAESSDALSPAARRIVTEEKLDPQEIRGSGKGGRITKGDALSAAQSRPPPPASSPPMARPAGEAVEPSSSSSNERFTRKKMSPLRRKIAAQLVMAQHTAAILTTF